MCTILALHWPSLMITPSCECFHHRVALCLLPPLSLFLVVNVRSLDSELKARFLLRATQLPPNVLVKRNSFKKYVTIDKQAQTTQTFCVRVSSLPCVRWCDRFSSSPANVCHHSWLHSFVTFDFRSARREVRAFRICICSHKFSWSLSFLCFCFVAAWRLLVRIHFCSAQVERCYYCWHGWRRWGYWQGAAANNRTQTLFTPII